MLLRGLQKPWIVSEHFREDEGVCCFKTAFGCPCLILLSQSVVKQF